MKEKNKKIIFVAEITILICLIVSVVIVLSKNKTNEMIIGTTVFDITAKSENTEHSVEIVTDINSDPTERETIKNPTVSSENITTNSTQNNLSCIHTYKAATCSTPKTCTRCGITEGEPAHSWGTWITVVPASANKEGMERRTCSLCQKFETRATAETSVSQNDTTKNWFVNEYQKAKQQYISNLNNSVKEMQNERDNLIVERTQLYVNYQKEIQIVKEDCANSGLSGSGVEAQKLKQLEEKYNQSLASYNERIANLEDNINSTKKEIENPHIYRILEILSQNCNISIVEAQQYYNKYSDSLN